MNENRIGAACWYKPADTKQPSAWLAGHLRMWGTDFDEPGGSGEYIQFPVGVIEDDVTGLCHSIYVTRICFAAVPPK